MATDAQTLLESASCYVCFAPQTYALDLIEIGLLRQWLLSIDPGAVTDPATLLEQAKCYACYGSHPYALDLIKIELLKQIVEGGGGGGSIDYNLDGIIDPVAAPADITKTWLYTNTSTGTLWVWPANGAAWQQIV